MNYLLLLITYLLDDALQYPSLNHLGKTTILAWVVVTYKFIYTNTHDGVKSQRVGLSLSSDIFLSFGPSKCQCLLLI